MKSLTSLAKKYFADVAPVRKYLLNRMPEKLHIEASSLCNLNCEYCQLRTSFPDKRVMSLSEFESLRRYFKAAKFISLSGLAEPLLNKNIVEFIKIIKKEASNCKVNIVSNALLLTETLSEQLIDAGLDWFDFSLDGVSPELVDNIRKSGDLGKIIDNVKNLTEIKRRKKSEIPFIKSITVLQRKNYRQLPETIELASELGVNKMYINGMEPYSEDIIENALWLPGQAPDDLMDILKQSIDIAKKKNIMIIFANYLPKPPICYAAETPFILPNGDVTMCAVLAYERDYFFKVDHNNKLVRATGTYKKKIFGNVFKNSLEEIWVNGECLRFRDSILKRKFPHECSACILKHQLICIREELYPAPPLLEAGEARKMKKVY